MWKCKYMYISNMLRSYEPQCDWNCGLISTVIVEIALIFCTLYCGERKFILRDINELNNLNILKTIKTLPIVGSLVTIGSGLIKWFPVTNAEFEIGNCFLQVCCLPKLTIEPRLPTCLAVLPGSCERCPVAICYHRELLHKACWGEATRYVLIYYRYALFSHDC